MLKGDTEYTSIKGRVGTGRDGTGRPRDKFVRMTLDSFEQYAILERLLHALESHQYLLPQEMHLRFLTEWNATKPHGDSILGEVSMVTRMLCRARGGHS